MKNILVFCLLLKVNLLICQIPNHSFEYWDAQPRLLYWQNNSHPLTLPPYDPYIIRKDTNAKAGQYAALFYGNGFIKPWASTTFATSTPFSELTAWVKYQFPPCVNDVGFPEKDTLTIKVEMLSGNNVSGIGKWEANSNWSIGSYQKIAIPINYTTPNVDSCRITIIGGKVHGGCGVIPASTEFWLDELLLQGPVTCIDSSLIDLNIACPLIYSPVCGCDGVTYDNGCVAMNYHGVTSWTNGPCGSGGNCAANFNYQISDSTVKFFDNSTGAGAATSWFWNFGNGLTSTQQNPIHTFNIGTYNVCLTVTYTNGTAVCTDMFCNTITITGAGCIDTSLICPTCPCPLVYNPVCGCDGITYDNSCFATNAGVTSYTQGECGTTGADSCSVDFTYLAQNTSLTFSPEPQMATVTAYLWNFGNGNFSNLANPTFNFLTPGWYNVCLTISGKDSLGKPCTANKCKLVYANDGCIDSSQICPMGSLCCDAPLYLPVCGCDSVTYTNPCFASHFGGVIYTYSGPCSTVSLPEYENLSAQISLYPNPAAKTLKVSCKYGGMQQIAIQNILGETLMRFDAHQKSEFEIDIHTLPAGMYLMVVGSNQRQVVKRWVKK